MAVPRKQRRIVHDENSSDSDNDSENGQDQEMGIVEVEFDVKIPESTDRHGIKNLLQQLFLKAHVNTLELADLLIEQDNITGVIKEVVEEDIETDDDMDINFGVLSVVNLTQKKDMNCIKQIYTYLLNHCKDISPKSEYEKFQSILNDTSKPVGLIISERFINMPAKISVPLYTNLRNDMEKEGINFAYYLLICKLSSFTTASNQENVVYLNPEEELIAEEAELSFEFQVQAEQDSGLSGKWTDEDDEGVPKRKVLLLPATKYNIVCDKLIAEFGMDEQQS